MVLCPRSMSTRSKGPLTRKSGGEGAPRTTGISDILSFGTRKSQIFDAFLSSPPVTKLRRKSPPFGTPTAGVSAYGLVQLPPLTSITVAMLKSSVFSPGRTFTFPLTYSPTTPLHGTYAMLMQRVFAEHVGEDVTTIDGSGS